MSGKMSLNISMGRIFFCAFLLACAACSHEQDEVRKDPCVNPDENVGLRISEKFEPADLHEGRYSVHACKFRGKGQAHGMSDARKYGLDHTGMRGSDVSVAVRIEWPEERSGLTKDALAKVRKTILWIAFADTPEIVPYSDPESLGETEESLRKHAKDLWAREGTNREIDDEFGLQPADWAKLANDALSHETGRIPAKDDGLVTAEALELGISGLKEHAKSCYRCKLPEKMGDSWWHYCSQWSFIVDLHLDWPFGVMPKKNAKWYERPVLCVWNEGYDMDGGNGCHDSYRSKVFGLPDGLELGIEDYFAPEKLTALATFVAKRFYEKNIDDEAPDEKSNRQFDLSGDEVSMLVSEEGVKWTWAPYSILRGCYGAPSIFIKWEELEVFK